MKIVILDSFGVDPGDMDWRELQALGDCTFHDRTPAHLVVERARDAEIVITNKTVLSADVIAQLPSCRYIGLLSTGMNAVDLEAARRRGIPVRNVPAYGTASVAQMVFAHILAHTNHVESHSAGVHEGRWARCPDFCYWDHPVAELDGQTLGIVGYGAIGRAVARIARAFGMRVSVHTRTPGRDEDGLRFVSLDELFRSSDIVTLHCPLDASTDRLVNAERLATMKPTALLINTSRAEIVQPDALLAALNRGRPGMAAVDVFESEPILQGHALLRLENCICTPHIGYVELDSYEAYFSAAFDNVVNFIKGTPTNIVNPGALQVRR